MKNNKRGNQGKMKREEVGGQVEGKIEGKLYRENVGEKRKTEGSRKGEKMRGEKMQTGKEGFV